MSRRAWWGRGGVASLVAVVGCSAHDGRAIETVDGGTANEPARAAVDGSHEAGARIDALRARFVVTPMKPGAGLAHPGGPDAHGVIGAGVVEQFVRVGERVDAVIPKAGKRSVFRSASTQLPVSASGDAALEDDTSHVAVRFALLGARDVPVEIARGIALYRNAFAYPQAHSALPAVADVVQRVHAEGTEDFVVFEAKPAVEALAYRVDVSRVAGLRLVSNVIEFLDAGGAPRLRVAPPWVIDARGVRHEAKLAIDGCAYDTDTSAPWGRKVTPPGQTSCTVRVSWSSSDGGWGYPALVDPSWVTTGSMATARTKHTATLLGSGKVLVAGGQVSSGTYLSTAELFNGTTGFAATGSMTVARGEFPTATLLGSGKVLVAGGLNFTGRLSTAELFDGTGSFAPTGSMAVGRHQHTATLLPSGKVLIAGGYDGSLALSSAELFDGTSFFAATGAMSTTRMSHTATLLGSGKVLIAGGVYYAGGALAVALSTAELFDGTSTFTTTGSMADARYSHTATLLGSGKVLITGGINGVPTSLSSAELFNGTSSFSTTGSMTEARLYHAAARLGSGKVLIAGGASSSTAELFDGTSAFAAAGAMSTVRYDYTATVLASGAVLMAGGTTGGTATSTAELFALPAGDTCGSPTACASGICNEHCCASACSGSCKTCAAGTGACTTVTSADDPDTCTGASSCSATGVCLLKAGQPATSGASCLSGIADGGYCCAAACGSCQKCAPSTGACIAVTSAEDPDTCTGGSACSAAGTCLLKNGQPSTSGASCLSGFSADGTCCNTACTGQCEACNVGGSVGSCIAVSGAPRGTRTACAGSGGCEAQCDGSTRTSCGPFPTSTTSCAAASCTSGTYTPARTCNGAGVCNAVSSTSCGAYTCNGSVCRASCTTATSATDCASGYFCSGGVCITTGGAGSVCTSPLQCTSGKCVDGACCLVTSCTAPLKCNANGAGTCSKPLAVACASDGECGSGHCVDGVCCDKACSGQCEACDVGGSIGTCVAVAGAVHGARTACAGTGVCQATCDGADRTKCAAIKGTSTSCAAASCTGGILTSIAFCDGAGGCATPTAKSCAPYICDSTSACKSVCITSADCAAGYGCKAGACVTTGALGTECTTDSQCTSGHCVAGIGKSVCCSVASCGAGSVCADTTAGASAGNCLNTNGQSCTTGTDCLSGSCADGVCCDKACSGQCEACDVPGSIGKCEAVTGAPHGTRAKCADGGGEVCKALGCDGSKDRTKCSVYANGLEKECAPAACSAGIETPSAVCDGIGACGTPKPRPCAPYVCDATKCKIACTGDVDCATGFTCNKTTAQCDPIQASCSDDGLSSVPLDKSKPPTNCAPYRCNAATGDCYSSCVKSAECAAGSNCDGTRCVAANPPSVDDESGGCGYSSRGASASPTLAWLFALGLVAARRRRRATTSVRSATVRSARA